jgi:hypothetical protein
MGSTRTLLTSQHLSTLPNLVSSFEHSEVLWDPLYMIRPRSVSAGSKCAASDLPDDLDVCRLSNRKHFDKTASRIDVGRTGGESESSRGAAIPEEHVRQPGAAWSYSLLCARSYLNDQNAARELMEHAVQGVAFVVKSGAIRIARDGITVRPLAEDALMLKTYLASRADERSKVVSELVRSFMRKLSTFTKVRPLTIRAIA